MTYTWHILRLGLDDVLNQDGVLLENSIVNIKWKRVAEDTDGTTASYVGNTKLSTVNTAVGDFTPLNDVSNATAIQWIQNNLSAKELQRINSQLDNKIERNRQRNVKPSW